MEQISAGGGATLRFVAVSNKTYTVQYKNSLGDPLWTHLADVLVKPTNRQETITDPGANGRFYRLATPLQP